MNTYYEQFPKKVKDDTKMQIERYDMNDIKEALCQWLNREYEEEGRFTKENFEKNFPDPHHIEVAYTTTPDEKHEIQYEIDIIDAKERQYVNNKLVMEESLNDHRDDEQTRLNAIGETIRYLNYDDCVYVNEDDLKKIGLEQDDEGNFKPIKKERPQTKLRPGPRPKTTAIENER